jgi:hypothetical protein
MAQGFSPAQLDAPGRTRDPDGTRQARAVRVLNSAGNRQSAIVTER